MADNQNKKNLLDYLDKTKIQENPTLFIQTLLGDDKIPYNVQNSKSPHFWWIVSTLGVALIISLAFYFCNNVTNADKIMEIITFVSGILSIILSIFAIIYTYTSNVQIQQQFEKINSAANNITYTSDKVTKTANKLDENLDTILNRLKSIDDNQKVITGQIKNTEISNNVTDKITNIPNNSNSN